MATKEELEAEQALFQAQKDRLEAMGKIKEAQQLSVQLANTSASLAAEEARIDLERAQNRQASDAGGIASARELNALQRQLNDARNEEIRIQQQNNDTLAKTLDTMQKINAAAGEAVIAFGKQTKSIGALENAMEGVLKETLRLDKHFTRGLELTKAMVREADNLRSTYVGVTGDLSAAGYAFSEMSIANNHLALSQEKLRQTQESLRKGYSQFVFLGQEVQNQLTVQTATMDKLNITAAETAETVNTLTMAFGMTSEEAMSTQREMVGLAIALGKPPQQMVQEFNAALPSLAKFGDQAVEVFRDLAISARETGLSVSELTGIVGSQMDTFEGSAKVAGRLNQVLGTDLFSGTELLMATEAERVEILRERLALSGQEFEDMNRFQRIAVMNAAGISDMTQAAKLFGNQQGIVANQIGDTGISVEEMEELARGATDTFELMKFSLLTMAQNVEPLARAFRDFTTDTLVPLMQVLGKIMGVFTELATWPLDMLAKAAKFVGLADETPTQTRFESMRAQRVGSISDGIVSNGNFVEVDKDDATYVAAKVGGNLDNAFSDRDNAAGPKSGKTVNIQLTLDGRVLSEKIIEDVEALFA